MAGLDLADHRVYLVVRRVYLRRWSAVVARAGLDPDDVLQDIYRSILTRNAGEHPFRARDGMEGVSNYAWMVCRSVSSNAIARARRVGPREVLGEGQDVALTAGECGSPEPLPGLGNVEFRARSREKPRVQSTR